MTAVYQRVFKTQCNTQPVYKKNPYYHKRLLTHGLACFCKQKINQGLNYKQLLKFSVVRDKTVLFDYS